MDADLDTLATALYVRTDDLLKSFPERAPWRPAIGIAPRLSDAELLTLAVMQRRAEQKSSPVRSTWCSRRTITLRQELLVCST